MDRLKLLLSGLLLILANEAVRAQAPVVPNSDPTDPNEILWVLGQPPDPNKQPNPPITPVPPPTNPAGRSPTDTLTDPSNRPPRLSLSSRVNWKAPMMGDFPGYYTVGTLSSVTLLTPVKAQGRLTISSVDTLQAAIPLLTRANIKVAENESPIPQDRVYVIDNYYYRMPVPILSQTNAIVTNRGPVTGTNLGSLNDILVSPTNAHVMTAGIEKTVWDGRASVGIRVPFYFSDQSFSSTPNQARLDTVQGPGNVTGQVVSMSDGLGGSAVGDMSFLFKYALFRNEVTGDLFATGLSVTVPTGHATVPPDATLPSDVLLQPFVGYVLNADRLYFHAFHSVIVPTQSTDVTLLANDFGVGYRLYDRETARGTWSVIPTFETHVTTPLTHRDKTGPLFADDLVVLTGGAHFVFGSAVTTLGVGVPVTGPRPFQLEPQVRLNWYY